MGSRSLFFLIVVVEIRDGRRGDHADGWAWLGAADLLYGLRGQGEKDPAGCAGAAYSEAWGSWVRGHAYGGG